jgi:hypothetical protein
VRRSLGLADVPHEDSIIAQDEAVLGVKELDSIKIAADVVG